MTKHQRKQVEMIQVYIDNGMRDTASRSLSALIRSAMTKTSKGELIDLAIKLDLVSSPDFII